MRLSLKRKTDNLHILNISTELEAVTPRGSPDNMNEGWAGRFVVVGEGGDDLEIKLNSANFRAGEWFTVFRDTYERVYFTPVGSSVFKANIYNERVEIMAKFEAISVVYLGNNVFAFMGS
jgi:hypothetical protein